MNPIIGDKGILNEELPNKESILLKQRRLTEQKYFFKDKLKNVNEGKTGNNRTVTNKVDGSSNDHSFSETINNKKQSSVLTISSNNEISNCSSTFTLKHQKSSQLPNGDIKAALVEPNSLKKPNPLLNIDNSVSISSPSNFGETKKKSVHSINMPSTSQHNQKYQLASLQPATSSTKHSKPTNINSKKSKSDLKREKNSSKKSLRKHSKHNDNTFFSTSVMDNYFSNAGSRSFSLPKDEYSDLMNKTIKNSQTSTSKLDVHEVLEKENKKCFYQTTPLLEAKEDDGPIIDCHIDRKNLILVHRDAINAYERKGSNSKEWCFKNSMRRLRLSDIIKEMIVSCYINQKDTLVLCQIHLTKDESNKKTFIKMAQYRFLNDGEKVLKEYLLGSFDCCLEKIRCCHIAKRPCCIAVTGWNVARSRTVGWVFTHTEINDTMRCSAMIPLKHEVESLHDISLSPYRNVLLAFGGNIFTIWNAKTGERLSCCSFEKLSPKCSITCHFGCFATIQKGFLFLLANTGDKLHMIATNLDTETSKSLRKFKIPRDNKCIAVAVKDDKLVGITDKSIICWSLKNTLRVQHLRLNSGEKSFLIKNKILITSGSKLNKILIIKSHGDYRVEMASKMKELMSAEPAENDGINKANEN